MLTINQLERETVSIVLPQTAETAVVLPGEVELAFSVALRDLLADDAFLEERWRRNASPFPTDDDGYFPIYLYRLAEDLLWGATARVVTELLCIVTGVEWPEG